MLCSDNEEIDVRDGCNTDMDCLFNAQEICDQNNTCFGIAWQENELEQKMIVCLSAKMAETNEKWHSLMKNL